MQKDLYNVLKVQLKEEKKIHFFKKNVQRQKEFLIIYIKKLFSANETLTYCFNSNKIKRNQLARPSVINK